MKKLLLVINCINNSIQNAQYMRIGTLVRHGLWPDAPHIPMHLGANNQFPSTSVLGGLQLQGGWEGLLVM